MGLVESLMGSVLSQEGLSALAGKAGVDEQTAKTVASAGLPAIMQGLVDNAQAGGQQADNLTSALASHAQSASSSPLDILQGADLQDGMKIVGHLLGGNAQPVENELASKTGASASQVQSILGALAPMLMAQVGQKAGVSSNTSGVDLMGLVGNLMGAQSGSQQQGGFDIAGLAKTFLADNDGDGKPDIIDTIAGFFKK